MDNKPITEQGNNIAVLWQTAHLRVTDKYETASEVIWAHGSSIGTLGNFSASTGKAKSKKTFNVSAIVAAALKNDEVLRYAVELPENKHKILYVDTEQRPYHCQKVILRALRLAGMSTDHHPENLEFLTLRQYTPEVRINIIQYAIDNTENLGLVIIDGIRDLMYDINNPSEASTLINKLMTWTDTKQIHIHTVLHLNKADDNTRGHIGTELNNKAETILQINKSEQDGDISEVKAMHIRDREFEPFAFRINEDALPELVNDYVIGKSKAKRGFSYTELTEEQHREALSNGLGNELIKGHDNLLKAIQKGYATVGFERGNNIILNLKKFLINKRMVVKEGRSYKYNSAFYY
ncbi:MAG: AAA family ATPase [Bacteroides sp.]|nr:AAA family ATPase [Bacteroides sp.]